MKLLTRTLVLSALFIFSGMVFAEEITPKPHLWIDIHSLIPMHTEGLTVILHTKRKSTEETAETLIANPITFYPYDTDQAHAIDYPGDVSTTVYITSLQVIDANGELATVWKAKKNYIDECTTEKGNYFTFTQDPETKKYQCATSAYNDNSPTIS